MKNKSYKKILALTLAATLVGGNAVATFATESTTNTGVTAESAKKAETVEAILRVHYVDENNEPLAGEGSIVKLTKTGEVGGKATFGGTDFVAPKGYTLVKNDLSVDVAYGSDKDINVTVKKLEEVKPETADATLYVHYVDENNVPLAGNGSIVTLTKKGKVGDTATFSGTDFVAPEGYTLVKNDLSVDVAYGSDADINVTVKKLEEVKPETAEATLRVHYVDENNVPLEGKDSIVTLTKTGEVGGTPATFSGTDFEAPEGYTLVKNDLSVDVAYGSDKDINVNVKKLEEEKVARDVIVNFNVDPEKGEFTDPAGAKVVTFTIKEDDGKQYDVPTVKAKEGYVFTGWKVEGAGEAGHWDADAKTFGVAGLAHFPEGSNEGYVTVTAQFEEAKPEVAEATLRVHFVDENNVPLDGEQYIVTKTKSGKVGEKATFSGTDFEAPEGYTLVKNDLSVDVAYGSDKDINVNVKKLEEEKVARDVIVNFNVDPEKGEFTDPAGAKVVTFTIKEDDGNQYLVPTVEAKEGYVFTGWLVNGEDEGHWDADAKTFGVTGLAHFPEGSNEGYVTVTAQFEEVKPEVAVANADVVVDLEKGSFDGYEGTAKLENKNLQEA
ncbi:MucBP domain-containing protein, partial [Mediterraneibacter faecis]|uniref:MucBP domain-containing protein n=1 Tax=Mediterraneibacter faecis TaxID=592978 RepID=UPI003F8A2E8F